MNSAIKFCIKLVSTRLNSQRIENIAIDVANQCRTAVTQQIISKSKILPPKQMRGYIRAYVTCFLESIIDKHNDIKNLDPSRYSKVAYLAKEFLIELVMDDMGSTPPAVVADIAAAA